MIRLEGSTYPTSAAEMVCGRKIASYSEIQANLRGLSREQRLPSRVVLNSNYGELWFGLRGTSSFESKC